MVQMNTAAVVAICPLAAVELEKEVLSYGEPPPSHPCSFTYKTVIAVQRHASVLQHEEVGQISMEMVELTANGCPCNSWENSSGEGIMRGN